MESQRERWDRILRRLDGEEANRDVWLERWMGLLEGSVLDLGRGPDTIRVFSSSAASPSSRRTSKRLFDRASIEALFGEGWKVVGAEECAAGRFGCAKTLWEVVVEKKPEDFT